MDLLNSLLRGTAGICKTISYAGDEIKKGVLYAAERSCLRMYDIYSLNGFERWAKAIISSLKFISLLPSIRGVFDKCLQTLEPQKDLYYASMTFYTTGYFVSKEKNGNYNFTLPRKDKKDKKGNVVMDTNGNKAAVMDWVKVLRGIANPFDTACFLQKYKVMSFPLVSKFASQVGSIKLFTYGRSAMTIGNCPVIENLFTRPKDFFMFFAAIVSINDLRYDAKPLSLLNMAKLVACLGKIILTTAYGFMTRSNYFTAITVLEFVASNASLLNLILKKSEEREERIQNPVA